MSTNFKIIHIFFVYKMWMRSIIFLAFFLAAEFAAASEETMLVQRSLLADVSAIAPGKPFTVGVRLKLAPDWHVYWINVGDTGIPTKITLKLPDGFTAGEVQFPTPHKFEVPGGMTAFGYADEVVFLSTVRPPKELKIGEEVTLSAKAGWLVCNKDNCVKGDATVELKLRVSENPASVNEAIFSKWKEQLPQPSDRVQRDVRVESPNDEFKSATGTITMNWKGGSKQVTPEQVEWFPAPSDQMIITSSDCKTDGEKTVVTFKAEALPGEKVSDASFLSVLGYTVDGKRVGIAVPIQIKSTVP